MAALVEDRVVQARKLTPRRGPRKLRRLLVERYAEIEWPPMTQPFAKTPAPIDTWCIDFKGKCRMQNGEWRQEEAASPSSTSRPQPAGV